MVHAPGHEPIGAYSHVAQGRGIIGVASTECKSAPEHDEVFVAGMPVGRHLVAVGAAQLNRVRLAGLRRVALENRILQRAARLDRWRADDHPRRWNYPFHRARGNDDVGGLGELGRRLGFLRLSEARHGRREHEDTAQTDVRESHRSPPVKRNLRLQLNFRAKPYTSRPLVSISERRGRGWVHEDFAAARSTRMLRRYTEMMWAP